MKPGKADMLLALGSLKKPSAGGSEPESEPTEATEGEEPTGDDMKTQASNDVFDALKADDRELFADALGRYVSACM